MFFLKMKRIGVDMISRPGFEMRRAELFNDVNHFAHIAFRGAIKYIATIASTVAIVLVLRLFIFILCSKV
jgi:hypothetical protein